MRKNNNKLFRKGKLAMISKNGKSMEQKITQTLLHKILSRFPKFIRKNILKMDSWKLLNFGKI